MLRRLRAALTRPRPPAVSLVVVFHDMAREAPRTLQSLSPAYQRGIAAADYEIIAVDNGSTPPLDPALIAGFAGNIRLIRLDPAPPSPVAAINRGLAAARGDLIGVMIDGARLVTPGLLAAARAATAMTPTPVVTTLGWYLGFDLQRFASDPAEARRREEQLLRRIAWPADGYRLFEIAVPDESSWEGWMQPVAESNALFLTRGAWQRLGGYDPAFDLPGGGLANLDTYARALDLPGARQVILLGEGSFHQWHGGIATNAPVAEAGERFGRWDAQYAALRGQAYQRRQPAEPPLWFGSAPPVVLIFLRLAIEDHLARRQAPAPVSPEPTLHRLLTLVERERGAGRRPAAALVARLALNYLPDEPAAQESLRYLSGHAQADLVPGGRDLAALGDGYRVLGQDAPAAEHYRAALRLAPDLEGVRSALSGVLLPGEPYGDWLDRFHAVLRPALYLEVGIFHGESLRRAQAGTVAIGIDPEPQAVAGPLRAETHIFTETSDAFFARRALAPFGQPVDLGFVDGLHEFHQALRDVLNLEAHCGPGSVILLHDTLPLDAASQEVERRFDFYTGDVWKLVPCLRALRPDLTVFTIPAWPSGLTVVCGFGPASGVAKALPDAEVARFAHLPYATLESAKAEMLGLVANSWPEVEARLRAAGVEMTQAMQGPSA